MAGGASLHQADRLILGASQKAYTARWRKRFLDPSMHAIAALFRAILRFAVIGVLVVMGIIGFFVAWWLVLFAALALVAYIGVRRMFGIRRGKPSAASGSVIIEGEYAVERDGPGSTERTRGRVIEVLPEPVEPGGYDKNTKP